MGSVNQSSLIVSTEDLRNKLLTRNLYNSSSEYPIQNEKNIDKLVGGVDAIINTIAPFTSFNISDTVLGRSITDSTPLTDIGLKMLSKQFVLNSYSRLSKTTIPTINVSNLLDGSKSTKLFTEKKNYSVTTNSGDSSFNNFLERFIYFNPINDNPFSKNPTNSELIENTGTAQLSLLYSAINKNQYKQNDSTLYQYAEYADTRINDRSSMISNRSFYTINDSKFNPYNSFSLDNIALNLANSNMVQSRINSSINELTKQEYAPSQDYVDNYFGSTTIDNGHEVQNNIEFRSEIDDHKIVWGIDGASSNLNSNNKDLRGSFNDAESIEFNTSLEKFNVQDGLLEYTKNLIISTNGQIGDLTKKKFTKGDKVVGYQGSGLWESNNSEYSIKNGTANMTGVRQHTVNDPYDRFTKAIRFNGNNVYNGNPNSVIYDTVMPKIHPTLDSNNELNNKDMMFSLENLAVHVIKNNDFGIIDDEYGSSIPLSEVGPFNGRIMWFPPYNLEINETAIAKYEPTVMVGRGEPMYNYINSERSAVLNFSLLMDYPEHLRNYQGTDKQKLISDFFAFGGNNTVDKKKSKNDIAKSIKNWENEIENISGSTKAFEPQISLPSEINTYFPNDMPKSDNYSSLFNTMYNDLQYSINSDTMSFDGDWFGLNSDVFYQDGMTTYSYNNLTKYSASTYVDQYNVSSTSDQFGTNALNQALVDVFSDERNRNYYDIELVGYATTLYTEYNSSDILDGSNYNYDLGLRRANSVKLLIDSRLKAIFGKDSTGLGININVSSVGSSESNEINGTAENIATLDAKKERRVSINIVRNDVKVSVTNKTLTSDEMNQVKSLQKKIGDNQSILSDRVNNTSEYMKLRKSNNSDSRGDDAILNGFKAVSDNKFSPVFHSQTPEDFHKRLTFLQQCTRQGSAKRSDIQYEDGSLRSRNSVFGRQPICILRVGDFFYTKVIIESVTIDYTDAPWDTNPEGFGMQPMMANVTLNMKVIGGQSLKGPIDALQNAVSFNYYANSTFSSKGTYKLPSAMAEYQEAYNNGINNVNKDIISDFTNNVSNADAKSRLEKLNNNLFKEDD